MRRRPRRHDARSVDFDDPAEVRAFAVDVMIAGPAFDRCRRTHVPDLWLGHETTPDYAGLVHGCLAMVRGLIGAPRLVIGYISLVGRNAPARRPAPTLVPMGNEGRR